MKGIYFAVLISLFFLACGNQDGSDDQKVVARVYNKVLHEGDVLKQLPSGITNEDSAILFSNFVDRWIKNEVYLHEAEIKLQTANLDIDEMIENYRSSLIIHHFEEKVANELVDSNVSINEMEKYYEENEQIFLLDNEIFKTIILRIENFDEQLVNRYQSELEDAKELTDIALEQSMTIVEQWLSKSDFLSNFAIEELTEDAIKGKEVLVHNCSNFVCLLKIVNKMDENEVAPFTYIEENIKEHILTKRKKEIIRKLKDDLYEEALKSESVKVNY